MQTLVIIESPGKRKKLEAILGPSYVVKASFGHVRDLPKNAMGVEAPAYRPAYVVGDDRAKETIATLKRAAKEAERVLLATDPDREGEAIAWHLADVLELKAPERITYGEITERAVLAAIAKPRALDMRLVHAQEARRVLDRLVGYRVSPVLSSGAGSALSAGRVQSPAVRLVVDRERAIGAFRAVKHYGAEIQFDLPAPWKAVWVPELAEGQPYMLDAAAAAAAAAVRRVRVTASEDSETRTPPPAPFTTSTLQQAAQSALKIKPKHAMELAQKLYEQGAITYMRTDSPNLSADAYADIAAYATAAGLPVAHTRRSWKAKGNAQEAHEAIRPTHIEIEDAGTDDEQRALYRLIRARALASQMLDATYAVRTAQLESLDAVHGRAERYQAKGRTLITPGWTQVYAETADEDDEDHSANPVPAFAIGDIVTATDGRFLTKTTKAPRRFTLASLVKALESHGIGRPATYASILDNILRREYITEDKKGALTATPLGMAVVDALVGRFDFVELDYTTALELQLDQIADGSASYEPIVRRADADLLRQLGVLAPGAAHPCPSCGKPMRKITGKRVFWCCSDYPTCTTTAADSDGAPKATKAPEKQEAAPLCPKCGAALRRKSLAKEKDPKGKGWDFWGCTAYPTCKATYKPDGTGKPILP